MKEKNYLEKIQAIFKATFNEETYNREEIELLKSHLDEISPYTKDKVFSLEDIRNNTHIYISPNIVNYIGYEREELYKLGALGFFKFLHYSHYSYPLKTFKYGKKIGLSLTPCDRSKLTHISCGLKVKNRYGKMLRLYEKTQVISFDKENKPLILLHTVENISSLFTGQHYWVRWAYNDQTFTYVHQKGKKEFLDILSPREQEILSLAKEGKSNQLIADILNLSKGTIETHRKNMLRRTGFSSLQALGFIWDKIQETNYAF